jgi:hypothetical protein
MPLPAQTMMRQGRKQQPDDDYDDPEGQEHFEQ